MEELDAGTYLSQQDLFQLFKQQLKKDFEGAGADGDFADTLPQDFAQLKNKIKAALEALAKTNTPLASLLYRVDIGELQLKNYRAFASAMDFEEVVAELIIKRILQKVILKKRFSS